MATEKLSKKLEAEIDRLWCDWAGFTPTSEQFRAAMRRFARMAIKDHEAWKAAIPKPCPLAGRKAVKGFESGNDYV